MSDEPVVLICALVALVDEPVLDSVVGRCGMCKEDVWMSPKMIEFRIQVPDSIIRCLPCAYGEFDFRESTTMPVPGDNGPEARQISRDLTATLSILQDAGVEKWPFDQPTQKGDT
jgi:hypothetical protein